MYVEVTGEVYSVNENVSKKDGKTYREVSLLVKGSRKPGVLTLKLGDDVGLVSKFRALERKLCKVSAEFYSGMDYFSFTACSVEGLLPPGAK